MVTAGGRRAARRVSGLVVAAAALATAGGPARADAPELFVAPEAGLSASYEEHLPDPVIHGGVTVGLSLPVTGALAVEVRPFFLRGLGLRDQVDGPGLGWLVGVAVTAYHPIGERWGLVAELGGRLAWIRQTFAPMHGGRQTYLERHLALRVGASYRW